MNSLREDADRIVAAAIQAAQPDTAVRKALENIDFGTGRLVLVAAGKAAWQMAKAAWDSLGDRISGGVVITKYEHSKGAIGPLEVFEAGHPVSDANTYRATAAALEAVSGLSEEDRVLFLLSGGGSALFEQPRIPEADWEMLNRELLASGADIVEMNTLRKRFSSVKGGRFALRCAPAKVYSVVLSDILGDPLDMIASGPAYPDSSTREDAQALAKRYDISLTPLMKELLEEETPKTLDNVETQITGSVRQLCLAAENTCRELGYRPLTLTASLDCTARDAGVFLSDIARYYQDSTESLAFLAGGETVVKLTGTGLGGRNQELALAAAPGIAGFKDTAVFSFGSDGTDGPTDAAGGYTDGGTAAVLTSMGVDIFTVLGDNDSYHALQKCGGLIMTGPTGTNVNDLAAVLIRR